ncbi:4a-hydroxytetrahydrobiopterin dehydratase [Crocinitomix catalasitica]|uniref:4a-hydroxytetrahydrobiopterin dehydratase n=1 Tax=Crocinitomix catalasitica TaxID=184607 RepID=UPI0005649B02|nr:4a-hydroxytetrahydrobiopterin dehydratase [Crocinitomix catalasitica]
MGWVEKNDKLVKTFEMESFSDIINRLNALAEVANEMNHHPDFEVFGYKQIKFALRTHDANSITDTDYQLAKEIDAIFE